MFKGQFQHNIDDKGRLVLPTKFRERLGDGSVITKGFEGCLQIYTEQGWEDLQNKLHSMPFTSTAVRGLQRALTGNASDVELDKVGRLNIPSNLKEAAGISKECTIVGVGSVIEIWATDRWLKVEAEAEASLESLAEQLNGFNI